MHGGRGTGPGVHAVKMITLAGTGVETTNEDADIGIKLGVVPAGKSAGGGSAEEGTGLVNISTSCRTFCSSDFRRSSIVGPRPGDGGLGWESCWGLFQGEMDCPFSLPSFYLKCRKE